ncbi:hypothetical protein [Blautia sp. 210702-DFI.1.159]|jgi:hypothetical protein|uniref:hypothetical protein n=1 Tax=Blautia sp. 210702-DFI.1.159 TaxID=2883262 RepID=UPI003A244D65
MQETRVLVETKGTTGEETISYWFDLPIDVAEFEEKLSLKGLIREALIKMILGFDIALEIEEE